MLLRKLPCIQYYYLPANTPQQGRSESKSIP